VVSLASRLIGWGAHATVERRCTAGSEHDDDDGEPGEGDE
jgi:hypothetical protein